MNIKILGFTEFQENTKGEGRQESKVGSATEGSAELGTTSPSSILYEGCLYG